jgi:hypothetical protein
MINNNLLSHESHVKAIKENPDFRKGNCLCVGPDQGNPELDPESNNQQGRQASPALFLQVIN